MHVISKKKLTDFTSNHADVKGAMDTWYQIFNSGDFSTPNAVKQQFGSADILPGDRIVFNIKGNHYRIVVKMNYRIQKVFIRFVGTHAEYDIINART
ncbi:MAG: type II toxin-antitoxin system HigB family toxin, partial [Bacteroidales bacterium]|nr:type II toxin-antitoxin system HigB family toxin [Bacteroidales bacterium]